MGHYSTIAQKYLRMPDEELRELYEQVEPLLTIRKPFEERLTERARLKELEIKDKEVKALRAQVANLQSQLDEAMPALRRREKRMRIRELARADKTEYPPRRI